ncbi:unnamed protein product [Schistocephalus solidus]|uniref:DUF1800 family protein n=1 Tax=Schistocephalus solidus TaxID=70667 RepID=A0A183SPW8_SCHSO|nr:unnamed protein product [Schistocephalus solidus]
MATSADWMWREIFSLVGLGDEAPLQIMRYMSALIAGRPVDNDTFRKIRFDKLPFPMQQVLGVLDMSTSLKNSPNTPIRSKNATLVVQQRSLTPDPI